MKNNQSGIKPMQMVRMYRTPQGWRRKDELTPLESDEVAARIVAARHIVRRLAAMVRDLGRRLGYEPGPYGPH